MSDKSKKEQATQNHSKMNSKFTGLTVTIGVRSLDDAISFYRKLGLETQWKWPEENPTHASLKKDDVNFMITLVDDKKDIPTADLYFWINDIKLFHQHLKDQGIDVGELEQTDYGMLDTSIKDPYGHQLTFGEPHGEYQG